LLDFVMPVMDGLEAAQELRKRPELQQTPIIGISATVVDKARKHAFVNVCDDFLPKPVELDSLLDKIQASLHIEWETKTPEKAGVPQGLLEERSGQERIPPEDVLDTLHYHVMRGNYRSIEEIMEHLMSEDSGYTMFCTRVRTYTERYDQDAILRYIGQLKGENQ
jgi:response regulator RpfG family c-di-GMP phosphodiesterase